MNLNHFWGLLLLGVIQGGFLSACATLPEPRFDKHEYPKKEAFIQEVKRPYTVVGSVKAKVNFNTLDPNRDESTLCRNYFNKAVGDLVKMAKEKSADAVINVRAVTFLENGTREEHLTPECADDGGEGQVLAQGLAVKWDPPKKDTPSH